MNGLLALVVGHRVASVQIRSHWYCTSAASPKRAVIAAKHPFEAELQAAKLYAWCACGHSKKQPFCDGTHRSVPSAPTPLRFKLEEAKKVWLCGCKQTKRPPYCDGTHKEGWIQQAALHASPHLE
ncbi:CDGSH iron-sulfur domain-containing protein 3, mitochondrial-like [Carcharodon carcharias]|uniref:CDGSH iron-sulfur domain-containing protein 3, mitochondrial-like n=1 Tax=Carcharodon carcharias TaxID=13397 RepID=UPI001B7E622A|nr:CDGSH iron-sulfur domain-containing protein 3, mitochondrial-like [Carcharodon carcharias]